MKEIVNVPVSQLKREQFNKVCREANKDFGVHCDASYLNMTFGFPWNTLHYKLSIEGETDNIDRFKKYIGVDQEEESLLGPLIFGATILGGLGILLPLVL